MTDDRKNRLVSKIKAMLNIAANDASTDNEIFVAMEQARKLMERHQLTESDLESSTIDDDKRKIDEADFTRATSETAGKLYFWEAELCDFVAQFVGADWYRSREYVKNVFGQYQQTPSGRYKKTSVVVWFGVAESVVIAKQVFDELRSIISTMAFGKYGKVYAGEGATYGMGFVSGLNEKYQTIVKIEEQVQSTALTVRKQELSEYVEEKAKQWLNDEHGVKLRSCRATSTVSTDGEAYSDGRADGSNCDVDATRRRKLT